MLEKLMFVILTMAEDDNTPFEDLMGGDWWGAITRVFSDPIGEFFFAILFIVPIALLYIKSQNVMPPALALVGLGAVLAGLFTSPIRFFFAVCAVAGLAVVLWSVAHR